MTYSSLETRLVTPGALGRKSSQNVVLKMEVVVSQEVQQVEEQSLANKSYSEGNFYDLNSFSTTDLEADL